MGRDREKDADNEAVIVSVHSQGTARSATMRL